MVRLVVPPRVGYCRSLKVRSNVPCNVTENHLDVLGFCDRHSPLLFQCRGTNIYNVRCHIRWELDANLLCVHRTQEQVKCHGLHGETGKRCASTEAVDRHGFCGYHKMRDEDLLRKFIWETYVGKLPGTDAKLEVEVVETEPPIKPEGPSHAQDEDVKVVVAVKQEVSDAAA